MHVNGTDKVSGLDIRTFDIYRSIGNWRSVSIERMRRMIENCTVIASNGMTYFSPSLFPSPTGRNFGFKVYFGPRNYDILFDDKQLLAWNNICIVGRFRKIQFVVYALLLIWSFLWCDFVVQSTNRRELDAKICYLLVISNQCFDASKTFLFRRNKRVIFWRWWNYGTFSISFAKPLTGEEVVRSIKRVYLFPAVSASCCWMEFLSIYNRPSSIFKDGSIEY